MNICKLFQHFLPIIWSVIVAYIIVAWIVVILFPFQIPSPQKSWSIYLSKQDYISAAIVLTVGVTLFYRCYQRVCDGYRYYYFTNYWGKISVFAGIALFWSIDSITTIITPSCCFRIWCLVFSIISFGFILCCCYRLQQQSKKDGQVIDTNIGIDVDITKWSPEQILEWAKKEKSIDGRFHDYFNMAIVVTRIANIIKNDESNQNDFIQNCSIGLMGKFGSGKTSLINLVKEQLNESSSNRYIFCCVSCWGFSTSTVALQFILDQIITAIANEGINTEPIRGLPTKYLRVITSDSSWWERLLKVFISELENTPQKILDKLVKLLQKEKRHLILVIEDIDRNEPKHFSVEDIFAALQNFKNVESNLSLILAGLPYKEDLRIDFEKLCDHIETIADMDINTIKDLLRKIASHHNSQFPDDVKLDSKFFPSGYDYPHDHDIQRFLENNFLEDVDARSQGRLSHSNAFRLLMGGVTPRTLKHIIRHLDSAWQSLHGECDYVELLLLTILRYAANNLFGFIQHNIDDFRGAISPPTFKINQALVSGINNPDFRLSPDIVVYWLNFLFPGLNLVLDPTVTGTNSIKNARGIVNLFPVDYFNRILSEIRPDEKISDQRALRAIQNWNNNSNTQELVDLLCECQKENDNRCERWLCALQNNERILDLYYKR
jgi:hypothetical protein